MPTATIVRYMISDAASGTSRSVITVDCEISYRQLVHWSIVDPAGVKIHPSDASLWANMDLLPERYGPFANVFETGELEVPGYLKLLNLADNDASVVLRRIQRALTHEGANRFIFLLLEDCNWRPQLVGCLACLLRPDFDATGSLWRAIDAGSWITPQLAVVLLCLDRNFIRETRVRVESGCPVSPIEGLSLMESYVATGPAGNKERSAKMMATLMHLSGKITELATWRKAVLAREDVQDLLASDRDNAGKIVSFWAGNLTKLFESAGLRPPLPRSVSST